MNHAWTRAAVRSVEQIVLSSFEDGHRIIGFTAAEPRSGVSTLALSTAEVFARAGLRTLFIDLSQPLQEPTTGPFWALGEEDPRSRILRRNDGADQLIARPTIITLSSFNNITHIRNIMVGELAEYSRIVIDIPAILDAQTTINPAAAAAACDSVLLVCVRGRLTRRRLARSMEFIQAAGGKVKGTVLNEMDYATPGVEIARIAKRVFRSAPRIAAWIERKALGSELLN